MKKKTRKANPVPAPMNAMAAQIPVEDNVTISRYRYEQLLKRRETGEVVKTTTKYLFVDGTTRKVITTERER